MLLKWLVNKARRSPQKAHLKYAYATAPYRVCHYSQLFVTSKGDVFPCCDAVGNDLFKIGHIREADLSNKILQYDQPCCCHKYRLRKADEVDKQCYIQLNVEMSLACQAKCIMCCVSAPEWRGKYDYYDDLENLIEKLKPHELFVQGGEVLIQKRSLDWLREIRTRFPKMMLAIGTNGNIDEHMQKHVEDLFDRFSISFVGFQPETYKKIMGLEISNTMSFVDRLLFLKNSYVQLKFLVTPINLHETGLFLQWALSKSPDRILISDAATESYINLTTNDRFWEKLTNLVELDLKEILSKSKNHILTNGIIVAMDPSIRKMFGLDKDYVQGVELSASVITHAGWFPQSPKEKMSAR